MNLNNHRVLFHRCLPPIFWWARSVVAITLWSLKDPVIAIMCVEDLQGELVRESSHPLALTETHWTPWEIPKAPTLCTNLLPYSSSAASSRSFAPIVCLWRYGKWHQTTLQPTSSTFCIHYSSSSLVFLYSQHTEEDWSWKHLHMIFSFLLPQ